MLEKALVPFAVLYTLVFGSLFAETVSKVETTDVVITEIATIPAPTTTVAPASTTTTLPPPLVHDTPRRRIPSDLSMRCPQWEDKFAQYGLPVKVFSYIAWRESRCNVDAHNKTLNRDKSQDYGLLQINSTWRTVTANVCGTSKGDMTVLFDVDCNLAVARYLYDNGGLGHWSL